MGITGSLCATRPGGTTLKEAGTTNLPQPFRFKGHDYGGRAPYEAYRAQFPEIIEPRSGACSAHSPDRAQIEMPDAMQPLYERHMALLQWRRFLPRHHHPAICSVVVRMAFEAR